MSLSSSDEARTEAAVWQAMVLFSTLSTAADVWHNVRERRAGRDPSAQEAANVVQPFLREAAGLLQAQFMQLQASRIQGERGEEDRLAALVRRYHEGMMLRRIEQDLHLIHQRLLSLYPGVSERLIEEARLTHGASKDMLDADHETDAVGPFVHRGLIFSQHLVQGLEQKRV